MVSRREIGTLHCTKVIKHMTGVSVGVNVKALIGKALFEALQPAAYSLYFRNWRENYNWQPHYVSLGPIVSSHYREAQNKCIGWEMHYGKCVQSSLKPNIYQYQIFFNYFWIKPKIVSVPAGKRKFVPVNGLLLTLKVNSTQQIFSSTTIFV